MRLQKESSKDSGGMVVYRPDGGPTSPILLLDAPSNGQGHPHTLSSY